MKAGCVHPVKIDFGIPVGPGKTIQRYVYAYIIDGGKLGLVDTGVAGADKVIAAGLQRIGRRLSEVEIIVLTHAHPDHIGGASAIRDRSGASVWAHASEREWIEDIGRQQRERPVPGFDKLVGGSVALDRLLVDGDIVDFAEGAAFGVLHTPGHSTGSISLLSGDGVLLSGDLIPQPGAMPIYDDVGALADSLVRVAGIGNLTTLYSSWAEPLHGRVAAEAIRSGMRCLVGVDAAVAKAFPASGDTEPMESCQRCVRLLGLPAYAANPLVLRSFLAHREAPGRLGLEALFSAFL